MAGPTDPIDTAETPDGSLEVKDSAQFQEVPKPIEELLKPDTELHRKVLGKVMSRVNTSARFMSARYDDWDRVDERMRLYVSLDRKARLGDKSIDPSKKEMPVKRSIVMPISLAMAEVRRAQFLSLFLARNPIFQIDGRSPDDVQQAKLMEAMIAYDCDRMAMPLVLSGLFGDADKYGLGILYDVWEVERGNKRNPPAIQMVPQMLQGIAAKILPNLLEPRVDRNVPVSEFNKVANVDPFNFFPDPRVPISRLQDGEFCGHLSFAGRMHLISRSTKYGGPYFNLDYISKGGQDARAYSRSRVRARLSSEEFSIREDSSSKDSGFYGLDHQQIKIIPKEWELGTEEEPTIWWFTVANETTIIRAHESPYDHGKFTYAIGESNIDPHPTMNPGMIENLDGIQRTCDWLINSRIDNVRRALHNLFLVAPSLIEMGDLENPGAMQHIRLTELGEQKLKNGELQIGQMLQQLPVTDLTAPHGEMFKMLFDMAQRMTAASDPAMGSPTQEQKTLGEVQSILAASSQRVAMSAKLIDNECVAPLMRRLIANRQQFTSMDQFYRIVGSQAKDTRGAERMMIGADDVQGDFDYIPNSGVMPADPSRNAETWARIFQTLLTVPQIQARPDGMRIDIYSVFDRMVESMGVRDIDEFYTIAPPQMMMGAPQVVPDEQAAAMAQSGQIAPMGPGGQPQ